MKLIVVCGPTASGKTAPAPAQEPAVVTEEETITIVAVPCAAAPADKKCADAKKCDADAKKCADDAKKCDDKKKCDDDKKKCDEVKKCGAKRSAGSGCDAAAQPADFSDTDYDLACVFMETSGLPHVFAPQEHRFQKAYAVLRLAEQLYADGQLTDCYHAQPEYLRLAEAERKLKAGELRRMP